MIFREVYVIICFWSFNVISRDKYNEINFNMKYIFNIYMFIFFYIVCVWCGVVNFWKFFVIVCIGYVKK